MLGSRNCHVRVEVEEDQSILLVLDRALDTILLPWQDAYRLAATIQLALNDCGADPLILDKEKIKRETGQMKMRHWHGSVALIFEHADRIKLSAPSARIVRDALKLTAQEAEFAEQNILLETV